MDLSDVLAILAIVVLWFGVFCSVVIASFGPTLDQDAKRGIVLDREEFISRVAPRLKVALPVFWLSGGLVNGILATHPFHVALVLVLVRVAVSLLVRGKISDPRALAIHVGMYAGALVAGIIARGFISH